jgi:hypothetical protein
MGMPHVLARPDEYMIVDRTRPIAAGHLDPGWYVYPSFYLYLVTAWIGASLATLRRLSSAFGATCLPSPADYLTTFRRAPELLIVVGRAGHALVGTATVGLAAGLAASLGGPIAAIAAAAILATNLLHVRDSHALKTDVVLAAAALVACAAFGRLACEARRRNAVLAGLAFGLSLGIKQSAALLVLPLVLAAVVGVHRETDTTRPSAWRDTIVLLLVAGLAAGAAFAATSPFMMLHLFGSETRMILTGLVDPAQIRTIGVAAEPLPSLAERYAYHLRVSWLGGCGFAFTFLGAVAIVRALVWREPRRLVLTFFVLTYAAVVTASVHRFSRYVTPVIPALSVLVGDLVASWVERASAGRSGRSRALLAFAAIAAIVAEPLWASIRLDRLAAVPDTRVAARTWLADHTRPGDSVLIAGTRLWGYGAPQLPSGVHGVTAPDGPLSAATLDELEPTFVLTHGHPEVRYSVADAATIDPVRDRVSLVWELDPFVAGEPPGLYEPQDALYMPLRGFAGVRQPGPLIRIYRVKPRPLEPVSGAGSGPGGA